MRLAAFYAAAGQGIGPQFSGSEPDVLPLDDPALDSFLRMYYINIA